MSHSFWEGRTVLVTGNTGFKGSWLSIWLQALGARVFGYALDPPSTPSLFVEAGLDEDLQWTRADIRDLEALREYLARIRPSILFHMAAQSLVSRSYIDPIDTFSTNVMGTVNVLEAARAFDSLEVACLVTSDKCYDERFEVGPHRESDPLGGGFDPYSTSKAASELVAKAYERSYFHDGGLRVATVRAGNVIGGGDWAADRLVPDVLRALQNDRPVRLRQPDFVRPWQHVLEPLHGYLRLAEALAGAEHDVPLAWNFGPDEGGTRSVREITERLIETWGSGSIEEDQTPGFHERPVLRLDSTMARERLGWESHLTLKQTLDRVVEWHRSHVHGEDARDLVISDIRFFEDACDCGEARIAVDPTPGGGEELSDGEPA